jgi:hypothetical protein
VKFRDRKGRDLKGWAEGVAGIPSWTMLQVWKKGEECRWCVVVIETIWCHHTAHMKMINLVHFLCSLYHNFKKLTTYAWKLKRIIEGLRRSWASSDTNVGRIFLLNLHLKKFVLWSTYSAHNKSNVLIIGFSAHVDKFHIPSHKEEVIPHDQDCNVIQVQHCLCPQNQEKSSAHMAVEE